MFKLTGRKIQTLVVVVALMLLCMASVSTAFASAGTGNQNPDLTVSVSLTSNGSNPDQATVGDIVTIKTAVTNNTARTITAKISAHIEFTGTQYTTPAIPVRLRPGQTLSQTASFTVESFIPKGTYSITIMASDRNGTSSATASITIV